MKRRLPLAVALWLLFACTVSAQPPKVADAALRKATADGSARVLVMLRPRVGATATPGLRGKRVGEAASRPALHPKVQAQVDRVLWSLPAGRARVLRRFERIPAVLVVADARTLATLARDPRVLRVDLDTGGGMASAPDESTVLNQAHQLPELGVSGSGMKVAVVDTGIDTDHVDFRNRIVGQQCFCAANCCPNGASTQSGAGAAEDDQGHGTNVAGIIGGDGTLAPRGVLPAVSLVAVKVLDRNGRFSGTADVLSALDWIASHHPDVDAVNLSLGTDALFSGDCDNIAAWSQALAVAVANLEALGAVVTASAGNQANPNAMSVPACLREVVSTSATWDFTGGAITFLGCTEASTTPKQVACFTNRSATTDLFAAGAFVRAPGFNGGTSNFGGSSQAAPMAAACAAALKQAAPLSTVAQRMEAMRLSPDRVVDPSGNGRDYPFLHCRDALQLLAPALFAPIPLEGALPKLPPRARPAPGG